MVCLLLLYYLQLIPVFAIEHRFPFSIITETKKSSIRRKVGDVSDVMERSIGRPVIRIQGLVSANNYIEFDGLHLVGTFLYIQVKLITKVATIHVEMEKSTGESLRLSSSTLYASEAPRYLGRSLR